MSLTTNLVEYETDDDKKIFIIIKYDENNAERLTKGGMTRQTGACGFTLPRRWLKPRFIDFRVTRNNEEFVERIFYKTHTRWKNDIQEHRRTIVRAVGESLSCTAISALYANSTP